MARARSPRAARRRPVAGLLTPTQYARRRRVTKQAVAKAVRTGRIPTLRRGGRTLIDPALADPAWVENTDPTKPKGPRGNGSASPAPGTQAAEAVRLTAIRRRTLELALRRKEGQLVDAVATEAHFQKLVREARDKFLALADRLGPEFAATTDPRQTTRRMRREFNRFLAEMAGETEHEEEPQRARVGG